MEWDNNRKGIDGRRRGKINQHCSVSKRTNYSQRTGFSPQWGDAGQRHAVQTLPAAQSPASLNTL